MSSFTTLAAVKRWLQVSGTADDQLLSEMIPAASAFIERYLGRNLLTQSYTLVRSGNGHYRMPVPNWPVTMVASVLIDGVAVPEATSPTAPGWVLSDPPTSILLRGLRFTEGVQNIQMVYTAGYPEVPEEIDQACVEMIALRYRNRDRIGHVSKSIGGETVAFSQKDMDEHIRTLLRSYMAVAPA